MEILLCKPPRIIPNLSSSGKLLDDHAVVFLAHPEDAVEGLLLST
jgi:hypothetical protein